MVTKVLTPLEIAAIRRGSGGSTTTSIVGITGTKIEFSTAVSDGDLLFVGDSIPYTLVTGLGSLATASTVAWGDVTGKPVISGTNTGDQTSIVGISGTKAQFGTAVTDGNIQWVGDAPTAHTHLLAAGATDVTITSTNLNTLDDGVDTTLHFHASDRARANHTGTQASSTISDFTEAAQDAVASLLTAGTNVTLNYNDAANTLTINASGGGSSNPIISWAI